jgi:hypothetical protein
MPLWKWKLGRRLSTITSNWKSSWPRKSKD